MLRQWASVLLQSRAGQGRAVECGRDGEREVLRRPAGEGAGEGWASSHARWRSLSRRKGATHPDKPGEADFEHSLPLDDVLERSILALRLNGEPIPAVHGGPVRLITPGYYGTMNVKWLSRLRFEESESTNRHHQDRYRTPKRPIEPGSAFAYNLANSEANWQMRIKSVIFAPLDGEKLPAGKTLIKGVAFNDGSVRDRGGRRLPGRRTVLA